MLLHISVTSLNGSLIHGSVRRVDVNSVSDVSLDPPIHSEKTSYVEPLPQFIHSQRTLNKEVRLK